MLKQRNSFITLSILMIFMICIYAFFILESKQSTATFAKEGILNLKNFNWEKHEIIELNGQWNFYHNKLKYELNSNTPSVYKNVPDYWEEDSDLKFSPYGYATYKLKITGLNPNNIYGLDLPDQVTSYSLYANNKKVASNGTVSKKLATYVPKWHPKTTVLQADKNGEVILIIEIANFKYYRGGFWNSIKFGNVNNILSNSYRGKLEEMFFFSTILIMGCFSLGLFLVYKRDKTTLYFALFCYSMAFTTFLTGKRIISDLISIFSWNTLVRLEFLSGYLLLPFFGLFVIHLFKIKSYRQIKKRFFQAFILFFFAITLLTPNKIYSSIIEPYKWVSIMFALYFLYLTYTYVKKRYTGSLLMLFAVLCMLVAIFQETFIRGPVSWLPFGSLNFVNCFMLITFQRFLEIIKKNDILEAEVILDPLTKLYNRNYLMQIEKNYFKIHKNAHVVFLDLDNFKYINDTFGHELGDFILQQTSKRLKNIFNDTDIICRYGGDEFVIITIIDNPNDIIKIAEKTIESIVEPFEKDGRNYQIGISIGIAKSDEKLNDIKFLIKKSDDAMYMSKKNGGNQYYIINN